MKSLAQLKRDLKVGTILKLKENYIKPERSGKRFIISKVQTNAIAYVEIDDKNEIIDNRLFWLWHPSRAIYVEYTDNKFKIFNEYTKNLDFEYIIESEVEVKWKVK